MNYKKIASVVTMCIVTSLCTKPIHHASFTTTCSDYVVVGVGTAGATITEMLSRDKETSVVAIHNGANLSNTPLIKFTKNVPFTVLAILAGNSPLYETGDSIPQPYADDREILWAIGKPEGGTSSINAGAYCRGTDELYAQWEAIAGPEWSVRRILDTYKALEHYHGKTTDPKARGYHGPLSVRQVPVPTKVSLRFTEAIIKATGLPFVLDYNDPQTPVGASPQLQYTQSGPHGSLRVSSSIAFLNKQVVTPSGHGVNGRKLRIFFNATGSKILWCKNKAVGIEYIQRGIVKKAYARKGVIVCAGLQSSPFLLRSGVGPRKLLRSLGIPVIFDNPDVGNGLADHPGVPLVFSTNPKDTSLSHRDSTSLFAQIAWLPDPRIGGTIRRLRFATVNPIPGFTVASFDLCQPKSRGTVSINSTDPLKPPVINLGILSNQEDLELLIAGLQIYIQNIHQALQELDPRYELLFPSPEILNDTALVAEFIKAFINSIEHFQSHCRMAPLDQGGVVDSMGRVYGVKNVFVADDSIVPQCMDGSPMASAYLIAANIARQIIESQ